MKQACLLLLISMLVLHVAGQQADTAASSKIPLPKLDGTLKTKAEFNTEAGTMRYEVRNARFGTRGSLNRYIGYRVEVDLSDEGKIKMLDAYVRITPAEHLNLYLGQRKVPFGTDYLRNPAEAMFANRSFLSKYVNDGLRDIGFVADYTFGHRWPAGVSVASINGTGNNNPQWINKLNLAARAYVWPLRHVRVAGNYYHGSTELEKDISMASGELRFENRKLLVETELLKRYYTDSLELKTNRQAAYVHAMYHFETGRNDVKYIRPVLRWDYMSKGNSSTQMAERITAGLNFGFDARPFIAEIKLNYEKYLKSWYPSHFDKFTIEFLAKF